MKKKIKLFFLIAVFLNFSMVYAQGKEGSASSSSSQSSSQNVEVSQSYVDNSGDPASVGLYDNVGNVCKIVDGVQVCEPVAVCSEDGNSCISGSPPTPKAPAPAAEPKSSLKKSSKKIVPPQPVTINEDEPNQRDFNQKTPLSFMKLKTCRWHPGFPRQILKGPGSGCKANQKVEVCVGYVICQNNVGVEFIRQSTCSTENCAQDKASACTNEDGFWSTVFVPIKPKSRKADQSATSSSQAGRQ